MPAVIRREMDTQSLDSLTSIQMKIYHCIASYKREHDGNSPTVREIANKLRMSSTAIHYQLDNLERLGLIKRLGLNRSRGIRLIGGTYTPPFWEGK